MYETVEIVTFKGMGRIAIEAYIIPTEQPIREGLRLGRKSCNNKPSDRIYYQCRLHSIKIGVNRMVPILCVCHLITYLLKVLESINYMARDF
ncbi:hypothetical protein CWC48_06795 [Pseudomonas sp. S10E 269]|nr:hypothetical protein CWC49_16955 [Pseudomonas sp. S09F 262]PJK38854.1 hypothetical protein CWC48_06795 [Pseudomonas sp. S10E 269]